MINKKTDDTDWAKVINYIRPEPYCDECKGNHFITVDDWNYECPNCCKGKDKL